MCDETSAEISIGIYAIKQQVRLMTSFMEIETEPDIRFGLECQKNAYEWALLMLGAAPADATLYPSNYREIDFDFSLFMIYCEVNNVVVADVDTAFRDFISFEHSLRA